MSWILPPARFQPGTLWSKARSAYRSATLGRQFAWNIEAYFLGKKKKKENITILLPDKFAQGVVKVKDTVLLCLKFVFRRLKLFLLWENLAIQSRTR